MEGRRINGIRVSAEVTRDFIILELVVTIAETTAAFARYQTISDRFCVLGVIIAMLAALMAMYKMDSMRYFLYNVCFLYAGKLLFSGCIFCIIDKYFEYHCAASSRRCDDRYSNLYIDLCLVYIISIKSAGGRDFQMVIK